MKKNCASDMQFHGQVTVWTKGQVVIPKEVRKMLAIQPWDSLAVITKNWEAIGLVKSDNMQQMLNYLSAEMQR